jgi:hypothetical protein
METIPPVGYWILGILSFFLSEEYFRKAWFAYHHGGVAPGRDGWDPWVFTWQALLIAVLFLLTGKYAIIAIVRARKH